MYDKLLESPYFNYRNTKDGSIHQVWYDDPESLAAKVRVARAAGLRGVGTWNLEALYWAPLTPKQAAENKAMWDAFKALP